MKGKTDRELLEKAYEYLIGAAAWLKSSGQGGVAKGIVKWVEDNREGETHFADRKGKITEQGDKVEDSKYFLSKLLEGLYEQFGTSDDMRQNAKNTASAERAALYNGQSLIVSYIEGYIQSHIEG